MGNAREMLKGTQTQFRLFFENEAQQSRFLRSLERRTDWTQVSSIPGLVEVTVNNTLQDLEDYYFGPEGAFVC